MKFDLDCVRDILIALEDTIVPNDSGAIPTNYSAKALKCHPRVAKYPPNQVMYTLRIMNDGGLVSFNFQPMGTSDLQFNPSLTSGITYAGHQYLASVRDDVIWKKTARKLMEIGGTASMTLVTAISEGIANSLMKGLTSPPSPP